MYKRAFESLIMCIIIAAVLSSCGSDNSTPAPEPPPDLYSYAVKIAYAYKEKEANTTRFGEITSYETYIVYGLLYESGQVVEERENCGYGWGQVHSINVSQSDYSYLWVTAEDGKVLDYDFYLTPDMLQSLGGKNNG